MTYYLTLIYLMTHELFQNRKKKSLKANKANITQSVSVQGQLFSQMLPLIETCRLRIGQ